MENVKELFTSRARFTQSEPVKRTLVSQSLISRAITVIEPGSNAGCIYMYQFYRYVIGDVALMWQE